MGTRIHHLPNWHIVTLALLLSLLLLGLDTPTSLAAPPLPARFYGSVRLSGANAPAGAQVSAWINGVKYVETTVINANGDMVYILDVPGDDPDTPAIEGGQAGNAIVLQVDGVVADQMVVWSSGVIARLNLTATPPPMPPVASNQSVTTLEDAPLSITLTAFDPNNDLLTYTIVTSPTHGALSGTLPDLIYTPATDFNGADRFTFKANDGTTDSNLATISIAINPVPDPPDVTLIADQTLDEGATLDLPIAATDPDGDAITLSASGMPSFASFQDHGNGSGTLTLAPGFNHAGVYPGLTVTATAGGLSANRTFTIVVRDVQPVIRAGFRIGTVWNVALAADGASIAGSSSQLTSSFAPANTIDDNLNTAWCTANGQIAGEWIQVALADAAPSVINRVSIRPSRGNQGIKDFVIRASTTTTATTDFTAVYTGTVAQSATLQDFSFGPVAARYVELRILSNWGDNRSACASQVQVWTRGHAGGIVSLLNGPPAVIVASSGQFNAGSAPHFAIDDDSNTTWVSANGQNRDQWLTVALGDRLYRIDRVRIQPKGGNQAVKDFVIRVSNTVTDTAAFTTIFTGTVANAPNTLQEFSFPPVAARYVQLLARNNYGSTCCIGVTTFQVLTTSGLNAARREGVGAFVAGYSSQLNTHQSADKALDYNENTAWVSTQGQATDQWIKVGLAHGDSYLIDRVRIGGHISAQTARDFQVRVSNTTADDAAFTTVLNATLLNDQRLHWFTFPPVQARYVQLFILNNYGADRILVGTFQVYSPQVGSANVPFDDTSVPAIAPLTTWHWDFGDGVSSDERYPTHTYAAPGVYTATMTVTDRDGITGTDHLAYRVLPPPTAEFTWNPERPDEGQQTNFSDRSTSTGGLLDRRWRFIEQANEVSGTAPNFRFPDNGDYSVRLTVTDWTLLTDSVTHTVSVSNVAPIVRLDDARGWVGTPTQVRAGVSDAGSVDQPTLAYLWDLGDGQTATGGSLQHVWATAAIYTVTLQVMDKDGGVGSASAQYTISKRPTVLTYLGDRSVGPDEPMLLAARLRNADNNQVLAGKQVRFTLGGQTDTATTDGSGTARANLVFTGTTGLYTLTTTFVEDVSHLGSTDSDRFATPGEYHQILEEAAQDGLDWLVPRQNANGCWGGSNRAARTGFAVLKLETHAVQHGFDPLDPAYPYSTQVRKGLDCLFKLARTEAIGQKPAGNPDSDSNGLGVSIHDGGNQIYQTGISAMALAASAHPEMTVTVASPVQGWTYRQVLVNIVDYLAWAQTPAGGGRGGWDYGPGSTRSDNSISGYATLGLVYAETPPPHGFGLTIPQFVKDELTRWVNTVQNPDGGSGYTGPGASNILRTGNLLQQMAFIGRTPLSPTVQSATGYIERHWNDRSLDPGWQNDQLNMNIQAAYTTLKGLEAMGITQLATEGDGRPHDWFRKMSGVIMNAQLPNGSWLNDPHGDSELATEWALLVLERVAPPVVKYDLAVEVTDRFTASPVISATVAITGPERRSQLTGADGVARFPTLLVGRYAASASASDYLSATTALTLTSSMTVQLVLQPIVQPPIARASGPYSADEGNILVFDGSASSDPNNLLLSYRWQFLDQAYEGVTVTVKAVDDFTGTVALTVDNGWNGVDSATAEVTIRNVPPVVAPIADQVVNAGQPVALSPVPFTDPGILDTHISRVEWGDGEESLGNLSQTAGSGIVTATHTYTTEAIYASRLCVTDKDGGTGCQPFQVTVRPVLPDLIVARVDRSKLAGDWQKLAISGTIAATLANIRNVDVTQPFTTTFFEDTNGNAVYDPDTDIVFGQSITPRLAASQSITVEATISTPIRFRDDLIFAFVDSEDAVVEADETNNYGNTGLSCRLPVGGRTYTTDADFDEGAQVNVNHDAPNNDQLQLNRYTRPFPYINVAASARGTMVRIDVDTGVPIGEYRTAPEGRGRNPSRTTVDLYGNVWVSNRDEAGDGGRGSVVKIGLVIGGKRINVHGTDDAQGDYLAPPFQYNTCVDRNSDGLIKTSRGLGDIRPWPDVVDGQGGLTGIVRDADDECILIYQRTSGPNVRHVSVDAQNNVWVAGFPYSPTRYDKLDGETGRILFTFPAPGCGGYGGLIDGHGVLWSASLGQGALLRYDIAQNQGTCIPVGPSYGLGIDTNGFIWNSLWTNGQVVKLSPDGQVQPGFPVPAGGSNNRGVAVTPADNHVWVANSGSNTVSRLANDGTLLKVIPVGRQPTGVAVDTNGKIWVTNLDSNDVMRIDPRGGTDELGAVDLRVDLGPGASPYNYSDMTGIVALGSTAPQGTWSVIYDSEQAGTLWDRLSWTSQEPPDSHVTARARSAESLAGLTATSFVTATNDAPLRLLVGRYLQAEIKLMPGSDGQSPIVYDVTLTPQTGLADLTAAYLRTVDNFPTTVDLTARIGNGGSTITPAGVPVAFYNGDPAAGGQLLGAVKTSRALKPGMYEDVTWQWQAPPAGTYEIYVVANDAGNGSVPISECDYSNNIHHQPLHISADLAITKTASQDRVSAGDAVTYTLIVRNVGSSPVASVAISDSLPMHVTFLAASDSGSFEADTETVTWPAFNLMAGAYVTRTLGVRVDATLPAGVEAITNTANVHSAAGIDANQRDNQAAVITPVDAAPDLHISKNDDGITTAPDQTIVYTLAYTNTGTQAATGVTITETVPFSASFSASRSHAGWHCADNASAGAVCSFTVGNLSVEGGGIISFTVTVDAGLPNTISQISNRARISDDGTNGVDPDPGNNEDTETTPVVFPNKPPVAQDDTAITEEDIPVVVDVLANDSDPDGDRLTITGVGSPLHGVAVRDGITIVYTPMLQFSGADVFTYTVSDGKLAVTATVSITVVPKPKPDLIIPFLDRSATKTTFLSPSISGRVIVQLKNQGLAPVLDPFQVTVFEDSNGDGTYTEGTDTILGRAMYRDALPVGASTALSIPVSGTVLFRDNLIWAYADSQQVIAELDEENNYNSTGFACQVVIDGVQQAAPDLTASRLLVDRSKAPKSITFTARVGNGGAISVTSGISVTFYAGNPAAGGQPIGTTTTTHELSPGEFEDVSFTWDKPQPSLRSVYVAVDDDGKGQGMIMECDEVNNDPFVEIFSSR